MEMNSDTGTVGALHLSSYIFVLYIERLGHLIQEAMDQRE